MKTCGTYRVGGVTGDIPEFFSKMSQEDLADPGKLEQMARSLDGVDDEQAACARRRAETYRFFISKGLA